METFPTYVKLLQEGFEKSRDTGVIRTSMEDGMTKQLKTKARVMVSRKFVLSFDTQTDYNSFITWFTTNINSGADWFNWTDPEDLTVKLARIATGLSRERNITYLSGIWRVDAIIETWNQ